jgi:predicted ATPase
MHIRSVRLLPDTYPAQDSYPFCLPVFRTTEKLEFSQPVAFFAGENGTGKSTLLRAIANACHFYIWEEREGIRDRHNPHEDKLHRSLAIGWEHGRVSGSFFAAELFRHFAEALHEWGIADPGCLDYFGKTSLVLRSHGQSHMAFFENRFTRKGLYLLDEPENALSPARQLGLLQLLRRSAARGDAQFIIATHSPILLALPESEIFSFDNGPIHRVAYEDTQYYRVYKDFLDNREKYLGGD